MRLIVILIAITTFIFAQMQPPRHTSGFLYGVLACINRDDGRHVSKADIEDENGKHKKMRTVFTCDGGKMTEATIYYDNGKVFYKFTNTYSVSYSKDGEVLTCMSFSRGACKTLPR